MYINQWQLQDFNNKHRSRYVCIVTGQLADIPSHKLVLLVGAVASHYVSGKYSNVLWCVTLFLCTSCSSGLYACEANDADVLLQLPQTDLSTS